MHAHIRNIRPNFFLCMLIVFTIVFGFAAVQAQGQTATIAVPTSSGVENGTLSWTVAQTGGICGPNHAYTYTQWNYTAFSFNFEGTTYPLSATLASYLYDNQSSDGCPFEGPQPPAGLYITSGLPASLGGLPLYNAAIIFSPAYGGAGTALLEQIGIVNPAFQVLSVLYSPPGNQSSQGYGSSTTSGTVSTVGNSFTQANTITFGGGVTAVSGTASFGWSNMTSNSSQFNQTLTDAVTVASADNNSTTYNPLKSDAVNRNLDTFVLLLNPQITVWLDGASAVSYETGFQSTPGVEALEADVVLVPAVSMEANSSGVTTVEPEYLNQQGLAVSGGTAYMSGLASICKNLNVTEYLNHACTLTDQCGCAPADFAPILALDPLLNYNTTTFKANPVAGTVSPLELDASGVTICAQNPVPAGSNCRFVVVPAEIGATTPLFVPFSGDEKGGYTQSYATTSTQTIGGSTSYTVGLSLGVGIPQGAITWSLKDQSTWTWTQSQSMGISNGSGNQINVSLQTSTASCGENVTIYEDTQYHTFAFQVPTGNSCP